MEALLLARTVYAKSVVEILNCYDLGYRFSQPEYFGTREMVIFYIPDAGKWYKDLKTVVTTRFDTESVIFIPGFVEEKKDGGSSIIKQ